MSDPSDPEGSDCGLSAGKGGEEIEGRPVLLVCEETIESDCVELTSCKC